MATPPSNEPLVRGPDVFPQPLGDVVGLESPGALLSGVGDSSALIDHEKSLGPPCVGNVRCVVHVINQTGHGKLEGLGTTRGHFASSEE